MTEDEAIERIRKELPTTKTRAARLFGFGLGIFEGSNREAAAAGRKLQNGLAVALKTDDETTILRGYELVKDLAHKVKLDELEERASAGRSRSVFSNKYW